MLRFLKIAIPSFLIGAGAGAFGWYAFSPLLFDDVVAEQLVAADETLGRGDFVGADDFHQGTGQASLVRTAGGLQVQLTGFEVTNGPDLKVYLSAAENPETAQDVTDAGFISLGALKGNVGDQAYGVPADADAGALKSVVIWCEQFGVLFASATLG